MPNPPKHIAQWLIIVSIGCCCVFTLLYSQTPSPMKVYLIPGLGSDYRVFQKLELGPGVEKVPLHMDLPAKGIRLEEYAKEVALKIDTTQPYALLGVSFGGMLCAEMAKFMRPAKIIIVSSAKTREELPLKYRVMKKVPVHRWVPPLWYYYGARVAQPLFEPDRKHEKETFVQMLKSTKPDHYKRLSDMIINWENKEASKEIIHIHGENDHTLPISRISADFILNEGSHVMLLTRAEELSPVIREYLEQ